MEIALKILDARLHEQMPRYSTPGSAGLDLRACIQEPMVLNPGEAILVGTGMSIHLRDPNFAALLLPRSGLGAKHGIVLGNLVGLLDSDYLAEVKISCWNRSSVAYTVQPLERIAQMVIVPVVQATFRVVDDHAEQTERNLGGFGSTGHL